ncbi:MAG: tRNA uridine-5-carboxymethylaminomethyl(34) synthesis enzyme MnmG, partial [Vampirovibrionales bacterium]
RENERLQTAEKQKLPLNVDFRQIQQIRIEAREKLMKFKPTYLAQARRLSGVNPADVQALQLLMASNRLPLLTNLEAHSGV